MTTKITVDNIATAALDAITPPRITSIGYGGDDTATDIAGNVTVTLTGAGFATGATVYVDGASAGAVSVISSSQLTFLPPVKSAGTYPLSVINPDGSSAIAIPGISYSGVPTYTTAAGNLANVYETTAINSTIVATGDAPITYSVYSGTLPPGANLSSSGNITGTSSSTASPTTYNFTVRATDAQNQDTNRPFSITVNPDIVTWSSPAADAILSIEAGAAMSNITFSAASAAGYSVSYVANILPTGLSLIGANVFGTPTVTGNTISVVTATSATTNRTANRTFTWVVTLTVPPWPVTAVGDAYGGGYFGGQVLVNGVYYNLVVSDKSVGQTSGQTWGTSGVSTGITSTVPGPENSAALAALGSAYGPATFCEGLNTGGYTDWYLPTRWEAEVLYYYLKPNTTLNNAGGFGANPYAVAPEPVNTAYTSNSPAQTTAVGWRTGDNTNDFAAAGYHIANDTNTTTSGRHNFSNGSQASISKTSTTGYTRAIRRVIA